MKLNKNIISTILHSAFGRMNKQQGFSYRWQGGSMPTPGKRQKLASLKRKQQRSKKRRGM